MSKIIPYRVLARQQHLGFLKHKSREYRERETYLARLRKLLFRVEAQMRQAEVQQLEVLQEIAAHFKTPLAFPDWGDRLGLQQFFGSHPLLATLQEFFSGRLTPEDCLHRIMELQAGLPQSPQD